MKELVLAIIAYAVQRDIDAARLCKLAGINLAALKKTNTPPVTPQQLDALWLHGVQLSNDPLLGLHFAAAVQPAALGVVGQIIQTSATVGEALTHAVALTHILTDRCRLEIARNNKNFTIRYIPATGNGNEPTAGLRTLIELLMVITIYELSGLMLEKIVPQAVRLPYHVPDEAAYEQIFRCRPVKRTGEYALVFDSRYWEEPILTANYELQELLLKKVAAVAQQSSTQNTLQIRVYNHLLANSYLGIISLEDMAANFNLSPRSLQRKLKEEGVKYQEVADAVRKSLALYYISSGNYPLKDISYMLGYNELSAFTRAFRRWTGSSPLQYQSL
ncbi:AraC family transcriptional regulator [Chitinophaga qingshengii]|uniref:AraC family transcriptional regulator n=1 Tax=Chitinophaga qingshengii TaxID=1569794 RepID=A0ABR7TWU2_9BACT|nr:AraC family transcriptional regulator [Chitinophaga qingshengii]MBC9933851.1 AraC family transcriptional regulator [Chitinophaga qingshengii]